MSKSSPLVIQVSNLASICLSIISKNLSVFKVLESHTECFLDRLNIPEIGKNFTIIIDNLKNAARGKGNKKGQLAQVEALEEKMKPFIEMKPGERAIQTSESREVGQPAGGLKKINSAVLNTADFKSKKKPPRQRKANDMDEESSQSVSNAVLDEDDTGSFVPQRRKNIIMDEDSEDSQSRPKTRAASKKLQAIAPEAQTQVIKTEVQTRHGKKVNKPLATQLNKKKNRRVKIEEEEDEEEDAELPEDEEEEDDE